MIVVGSHALALQGIHLRNGPTDLDLIGTPDEVAPFRTRHAAAIVSEQLLHGHRHVFQLSEDFPFRRVEIDIEQTASDRMLPDLCPGTVNLLGERMQLAPVEVLFLIKRALANVPLHYDKGIRDIIPLTPLIKPMTEAQETFYRLRKGECIDRYRLHRQRFVLSIPNDEFFAASDHVRLYVHDDLHEVVAFRPGAPLYKECKRDLSLAKIDVDLFERLSPDDRLRMVQEEFMVIGLERFYLRERTLNRAVVYERGMHKTIRDLFVGYFQDFCIDHIAELVAPPEHDFVARFERAEAEGRLRKVELPEPTLTDAHRQAMEALHQGRVAEARRIGEDLLRRASVIGDPYAMFILGVVMFREKNWKLSERLLRDSIARHRNNPAAVYHLGVVCRITNRPAEARTLLESAIAGGVRNYAAYVNLGLACESNRAFPEALAAYRAALQLPPGEGPDIQAKIAAIEAMTAPGDQQAADGYPGQRPKT